MEVFNKELYNTLSFEDKEIINEYLAKLSVAEINSFMKRLVFHAAEILEVKEDIDAVLVYENAIIVKQISKQFVYDYFDRYFVNKNGKNNKLLYAAIKKYLLTFDDFFYFEKAQERLYNICAELTNKHFIKINKVLPICLYTYKKDFKQFGIVLDRMALLSSKNKSIGYSKNYKPYEICVLVDHTDISRFIKKCVYWTQKNANKHGFNKNTGIIWLNGKQHGNEWHFPDGTICNINGSFALVKASITTDAFDKMLYRFNFVKRLKEIEISFEKIL